MDVNFDDEGLQIPILKALAHPLRHRILMLLHERVASPSDLAPDLGESVPNVAYHMGILERYDCVELIGTQQRRGAIEHLYRAKARLQIEDGMWGRLPPSARDRIAAHLLQDIVDHAAAALANGGFDDPRIQLSHVPFVLDEQGWQAMADLLNRTLDEVMAIGNEALERTKSEPTGQVHRTEVVLMHFVRSETQRSRPAMDGASDGQA